MAPAKRACASSLLPLVLPSPLETDPPGTRLTWAAATHAVGLVMTLVSSVTAPLRASRRPTTRAPVVAVMLVLARTVPTNLDPVPNVAELPTCQTTLQERAPLMRLTRLPDPVVSEDPAWKTKTEFGLPAPSKVTAPVSPIEEAEL